MRAGSVMRLLVPVVVLPLAAIAATLLAILSPDVSQRHVSALDFDTGNLQGTVHWNGTPVTGLRANYYSSGIYVGNGTSSTNLNPATGSYSFTDIPVGTYTPRAFQPWDIEIGHSSPAVVTAGQTTTADIDLTYTAGEAVGLLKINGAALPDPLIIIPTAGLWYQGDGSGRFAILLPPGTYTAYVYWLNDMFCRKGSFTFSVTAGETTDLGTIHLSVGFLRGNVYWNGTPVAGPRINLYVWGVSVSIDSGIGYSRVWDGSYHFSWGIPVGTRTLTVFNGNLRIGEGPPVVISRAATTTADIDLTSTAGEVVGVIKTNGQPVARPRITIPEEHFVYEGDDGGNFAMLLPPGTYTANTYGSSFTFDVTAGQTTDVGDIAVSPTPTPTATATFTSTPLPSPTPPATPTPTPSGVGGRVKLPPAITASESTAPADGSGWSASNVALAGAAVGGTLLLAAGGWYAQRRWLR